MSSPVKIPILYSFRRCPYAMRARMALMVAGEKVELREVVLKQKPQAMLDISPKGSVPVLLLEAGEVIDESMDIMRWALQQNDSHGWLNCDSEMNDLVLQNDGGFKYVLDRYKYISRYSEEKNGDWRAKCEEFFDKLDCILKQQKFLGGDAPRLPDYAIFPFIRQARMPDEKWFDEQMPYSKMREWLSVMIADEIFLAVMKKYATWQQGDEPIWLS